MSQLFDSLRRDRDAAHPRVQAPRTLHGDAVLATLGYARVERRPAAAAVIAAALLFGIAVVLWSLWTFYGRSEPANPIPRPEAPRSSPRQPPGGAGAGTLVDAEGAAAGNPALPASPLASAPRQVAGRFRSRCPCNLAPRDCRARRTRYRLPGRRGNAVAHCNPGQLYDEINEPARAVEHDRRFLDTAGADYAARTAAVRARIAALSRTPE